MRHKAERESEKWEITSLLGGRSISVFWVTVDNVTLYGSVRINAVSTFLHDVKLDDSNVILNNELRLLLSCLVSLLQQCVQMWRIVDP